MRSAESNGLPNHAQPHPVAVNGNHSDGSSAPQQTPIAVVGMSCRLPGDCNSPQALWEFLMQGSVAESKPPKSRFNLSGHYDGSGRPGTLPAPGAMFLEKTDISKFDSAFFNISYADAISMDPQQRLLLEAVYECTENCGLPLETLRGAKIGCLVGANTCDYESGFTRDPEDQIPGTSTGLSRSILSNRLSHFLDVTGPSITLDTACSSTLIAVDMACSYLQSHQADGMFVAGSMLFMDPGCLMDFGPMGGAFSNSGRCHTFDAKADGYVRGEAINVVFLKRLSDAIRDNDPIRAVIRGTATNSDGRTPGITYPNSKAHARAIKAAYQRAGITNLNETGYLECHGTGTLAGDPMEVEGIASVFAPSRSSAEEDRLIIGSVKSNIGHSEPAAGLSGLIKAVLALERGIIPGNPTFITPNPRIDFEGSRVRATRTRIRWPTSQSIRRASINSFGFGGANAHAVLEAMDSSLALVGCDQGTYRRRFVSSWTANNHASSGLLKANGHTNGHVPDGRPHLLVFSANDKSSLEQNVEALSTHLINPAVSCKLRDVAYTLSERRTQHFHRAYFPARSLDDVANVNPSSISTGKQRAQPPRIGFVFTGQGAQWSQMGKDLVNTFPVAEDCIRLLDRVLQDEVNPPPSWSLLEALTEETDAQRLRLPELAQPLTTALQLAMLAVLRDWGVRPNRVVGHSSGEIAAAVAAGKLTPSEAIKVAYFRGLASQLERAQRTTAVNGEANGEQQKLGMLAVGASAEDVAPYLDSEQSVQIACYNSPGSVTLSGPQNALQRVQDAVKGDNRFARALQVDSAYHHSKFMEPVAVEYERLMREQCPLSPKEEPGKRAAPVSVFSSVSGGEMTTTSKLQEHTYWRTNMVSPVRFSEALSAMVSGRQGSELLIEIGPSNALKGPVAQILAAVQGADTKVQYVSAAKRGGETLDALLGVAGALWACGCSVDLCKVNGYSESGNDDAQHDKPSFIIDLPNYQWNHSVGYWHESLGGKDWRFRRFITHDLLGSKMLGVPWTAPTWNKVLKLDTLPWLRDHDVAGQVIFPAAGYIALAIEAIYQHSVMNQDLDESDTGFHYRLKDVKFIRGLVLGDSKSSGETCMTLSLNRVYNSPGDWHEFRVLARKRDADAWSTHCVGLVRIEQHTTQSQSQSKSSSPLPPPPPGALDPLQYPHPGSRAYRDASLIGYNFGPSFQRVVEFEWLWGGRQTRGVLSMEPATSPPGRGQSSYPIHPVCFDSFLQLCGFPIRQAQGNRNDGRVIVPARIESLVVAASREKRGDCFVTTRAYHIGVGDEHDAHYNKVSGEIYDPAGNETILAAEGVSYETLDAVADRSTQHMYATFEWDADLSLSDGGSLDAMLQHQDDPVQRILDLVLHRQPRLNVLEVNTSPDDMSCLWLHGVSADLSALSKRLVQASYQCLSTDPGSVTKMQTRHTGLPRVDFDLASDADDGFDLGEEGAGTSDLVILKITDTSSEMTESRRKHMLQAASLTLKKPGQLFIVDSRANTSDAGKEWAAALGQLGFTKIKPLLSQDNQSPLIILADLTSAGSTLNNLVCLRFTDTHQQDFAALQSRLGLAMPVTNSTADLNPGSNVLVVDELWDAVSSEFTAHHWDMLQELVQKECNILWVTSGAQLAATSPHRATTQGLLRVIRNEEPHLRIVSLDVEEHSDGDGAVGAAGVSAIKTCLEHLVAPPEEFRNECEFVERGGLVHTSRVVTDEPLNEVKFEHVNGRSPQSVQFGAGAGNGGGRFQLRAERRGAMDSLHYVEESVSRQLPPPAEGYIEVDVRAAGVNFKDVAVVMGWAAGNQEKLGLEGAGVVSRVGAGVSPSIFKPGQRVVFLQEGSFANKVQVPMQAAHAIPDAMPFDVAASLPVAYLTSLCALLDLGNLKRGQRVLIHSAAGAVGNAAMQICRYMGAEIYATVGSEEKRVFLQRAFGIPADRIFSSRTAEFEPRIMQATGGYGVDIVLNSLSGELLEASWNTVAFGGTLVEIGKRDINDQNRLSMVPFNRGASFRALDLSLFTRWGDMLARLFNQLFDLLDKGHIKPLFPLQRFGFDQVQDALIHLRTGKHIGKLVLSSGADEPVPKPHHVQVRPAPRAATYRDNACYLIVGGLRGLCGSLALDLAKRGVKHIATMSRSGYDDPRSQIAIRHIRNLGSHIDLLRADVTNIEDVRRALKETTVPVGGVIQGAMVPLDRPFSSMTIDEYHAVLGCKVQGTWNLHTVALELGLNLDFFTLLSSIASVLGGRAQANYVAANAFLDAFPSYRHRLGLPAHTINLGVVEDVGFMVDHDDVFQRYKDSVMTFINEDLLCRLVQFSILQQSSQPVSSGAASLERMVTGLGIPQAEHSGLREDPRFGHLFVRDLDGEKAVSGKDEDESKDVRALKTLLASSVRDQGVVLDLAVKAVSAWLFKTLRLREPVEAERPLSAYGLDSLAAVEFRNWVRSEVGAVLTTLDITTAASLNSLCEVIVAKAISK